MRKPQILNPRKSLWNNSTFVFRNQCWLHCVRKLVSIPKNKQQRIVYACRVTKVWVHGCYIDEEMNVHFSHCNRIMKCWLGQKKLYLMQSIDTTISLVTEQSSDRQSYAFNTSKIESSQKFMKNSSFPLSPSSETILCKNVRLDSLC